ncbi:hypothetical protein KC992_02725 [Candidatus Saccharibacteria bacterium]|nr:hypothetical protein [Candidatus Saccharibacteria bacterium]
MKKWIVLLVLFAPLVFPGRASAQQLDIDPCDPQQNEVIAPDCPDQEEPVPEETKGEPNSETVAGTDAELAPQTGVLGASTEVLAETDTLADTGVETWIFVVAGLLIITETAVLFTINRR